MFFNCYITDYRYRRKYPNGAPIDEAKVIDAIAKINSSSFISIRKAANSVGIHIWVMKDRIKRGVPALKEDIRITLPYKSECEVNEKHTQAHPCAWLPCMCGVYPRAPAGSRSKSAGCFPVFPKFKKSEKQL